MTATAAPPRPRQTGRSWILRWEEIITGPAPTTSPAPRAEEAPPTPPVRRQVIGRPWNRVRPDGPLQEFLTQALSENSPDKVVAAARAMRLAGFTGRIAAPAPAAPPPRRRRTR